jgi:hypothetical protein
MNPFWEEDLAHQMPTVIIGDIEVTKAAASVFALRRRHHGSCPGG